MTSRGNMCGVVRQHAEIAGARNMYCSMMIPMGFTVSRQLSSAQECQHWITIGHQLPFDRDGSI